MNRRDFLRRTAALAAAAALPDVARASEKLEVIGAAADEAGSGKLIVSAPMLQNYAETSMGVAFAVSDMANGYVRYSTQPDMSDAVTVKCGGFRVTDMNEHVMLIRLTGLKPATKYWYTIGADRISYKGGYDMTVTGNEEDPRIYSFTTAGKGAASHFCVINDTHARWDVIAAAMDKVAALAPSCVVWNGDATNCEEEIDSLVNIFLDPDIERKDYAAEMPYMFCSGNHDSRGLANRHLERVWMFRQPEERASRDWDLGRNFAVRMGDIAMIGLDTAEDKQDTNPIFAGLFNSAAYREAQTEWLKDALSQKEIASAPYLVAFCHIPLFDPDPKANPGDLAPADVSPDYRGNFASWQRTCANMWGPLLTKAGCQLVVTAHQHRYRFDEPDGDRTWAHMVGGGPSLRGSGHATVIEGKVDGGKLTVTVHNLADGSVKEAHTFSPRKKR
ncbi:MAG: metallophosphoesterase [Bacteroidales bacterium]|nr:metallophosphoesterase [Bacteroidales bacterium]